MARRRMGSNMGLLLMTSAAPHFRTPLMMVRLVTLMAMILIVQAKKMTTMVGHGNMMTAVCTCGASAVTFTVPCRSGTDCNAECSKTGGVRCKLSKFVKQSNTKQSKGGTCSCNGNEASPGCA